MKELFQFLWRGSNEEKFFQSAFFVSSKTCPLMHIEDFSALVADTACSEEAPAFLIVASDSSSWDINALLTDKPDDLARVMNAASISDPVHPEKLKHILRMMQVNVTAPVAVSSSLKYPCGLYDFFDTIWNEFTSGNGLRPFHILLAGPPQAGKTLCSNTLATK
jgi:hypothetical protein